MSPQRPRRSDPDPLSGAAALPDAEEQRPDDECVQVWVGRIAKLPPGYREWAERMVVELMAERARLEQLEESISTVYVALTGRRLSKPWYSPQVIISDVEEANMRDTLEEVEHEKKYWLKTLRVLWDSRRHWQRHALADITERPSE